MKKRSRMAAFFLVVVLSFIPSPILAFNPGAHIYIAAQVFPLTLDKTNLFYCTIAPDLAMYGDAPQNWPDAFADTHYNFIKLPYSWLNPTQKACAKGWQIHNEIWGADYYAHGTFPTYGGYVIKKAAELVKLFPVLEGADYGMDLAHFAVEVAIDWLLVEKQDPFLGHKVLGAALLRSEEVFKLLKKTFVEGKQTDLTTLSSAESAFREVVIRYGTVLTLPDAWRMAALGEMGVQVAAQFGVNLTSDQVQAILKEAIKICQADYLALILNAINKIKKHPELIR